MSEFRWIKTSLFLILVLQFTAAATGQRFLYVTVRDGDEVTLSCNSLIDDQQNCDSTMWIFTDSSSTPAAVVLVRDGKIVEEAKAKSDRLSVSEKCSLVIKNVTDEDVGQYVCRQLRSRRKQGPDALVYLSVVTMTEQKNNDEVTLRCSVSTYEECDRTVKWLLQGQDNRDMTTSQSLCSATASFSTSHFIPKKSEFLKCQVTDYNSGEVKLFSFSPPQSSGEDATTGSTPRAATTKPEGWSVLDYMMLVLRVAEVLLMTVIVVLLIRARGNQRPPDHNTVHGDKDGHEGAVNYENVGDPSVSVRLP
ncbi:uncharacterized protein [Cebidichthys violaceus]|uniref:uncharacterized protein isoform X3 n=1 Tax=Cebidichthys violaceus TaxID=271503 RepID=UPI0035C9CBB4